MMMLIRHDFYDTAMWRVNMKRNRFLQMLTNPPVIADKLKAPLGLFGYPIDTPVPTAFGRNDIHFCADNVECLTCIQLDFDSSISIDEFNSMYEGKFRYILYTSHGHGYKGDHDRFRVIIPLERPLSTDNMGSFFRDAMADIWNCDPSCFDKAHMQCLPCIREPNAPYRYHIANADCNYSIPWDKINAYKERYTSIWAFSMALNDWYAQCDDMLGVDYDEAREEARINGAINRAQDKLDAMYEGERNNTMFSVVSGLCRKGVPAYRVHELVVPHEVLGEFEGIIKRIYKY